MGLFTKRYRAPGGDYYKLYMDMLHQKHLLIAGATGSGKSVVINGLIYTALLSGPDKARFILIDPKRVELVKYARCPHTIAHVTEPAAIIEALRGAVALIDARYKDMSRRNEVLFSGHDVYIVIDELADLMTTSKKEVQPLLQRICQIGRAARVHVIAATQCPLVSVIPTAIKVNFDSVVALHTASAQHSRNIMESTGCETLPPYGQGYYRTPSGTTLYNIPMYSQDQLNALAGYWSSSRCRA